MQAQLTRPKAVSVTTKQQVCTMCSGLEKWGLPYCFKRILKSMLLNNSKLSYKKNCNCWKLYGGLRVKLYTLEKIPHKTDANDLHFPKSFDLPVSLMMAPAPCFWIWVTWQKLHKPSLWSLLSIIENCMYVFGRCCSAGSRYIITINQYFYIKGTMWSALYAVYFILPHEN